MMAPERWQRVNELFHSALAHDAAERAAFLRQACAEDDELRQTVEALIASYETPGSFINSSPLAAPAEAFEKGELSEGQAIGHYRVIGPLGEGGMGGIYLAEDPGLGRKVAIKLLPPLLAVDPQLRARLRTSPPTISARVEKVLCRVLFFIG